MKIFANESIRRLFVTLGALGLAALAAVEALCRAAGGAFSWLILAVFLMAGAGMTAALWMYFQRQNRQIEDAADQIEAFLSGNESARVACDEEGELYRLFQAINTLAAVLTAHADNEQRDKVFLKNTISDISHQLKTPLAALNIYNGLMQGGENSAEMQQYAALSEKELDRMETLVQSLLKITRLDAGAIVFEKAEENVTELMESVKRRFDYHAEDEGKTLTCSGAEDVTLFCDRSWMQEAVSNIVKNAFDHTKSGDTVALSWARAAQMVTIRIRDTGRGIHPEDLPHIFKRFYRSRFSTDTQGVGLGLPLAKAIVEANGGTLEVDSELGRGTTFTMRFLVSGETMRQG